MGISSKQINPVILENHSVALAGAIRFNTVTSTFEGYNGTVWEAMSTGEVLPVGTVNNSILRWDSGTTNWVEEVDFTVASTSGDVVLSTPNGSLTFTAGTGERVFFTSTVNLPQNTNGTAAGDIRYNSADSVPQYYNGSVWRAMTIASLSGAGLTFDQGTGVLTVGNLLISDVTVDTVQTSLSAYLTSVGYDNTGALFQEGDTLVLTNTPNGPQTWIHNGGVAGTASDFTQISANLNDTYIRSLFSAAGNLNYNSGTGEISIDSGYDVIQDGTNVNSTIRWNGSNWVENTELLVATGGGFIRLDANTGGNGLAFTSTGNIFRFDGTLGGNYPTLYLNNAGATTVPTGAAGMIIWNNTAGNFQGYNGTSWVNLDNNNTASGTTTNSTLRWNGTQWVETTQLLLDSTTGAEVATFTGKITIGNSTATQAAGQMRYDGSGNLEYYNGSAWVRLNVSIGAGSTNLLNFNSSTGQLTATNLLVTDVTVDTVETSIASYVSSNYTGTEHLEGDIIVLTNATNGPQTWIHNGGVAATVADFTQISVDVTDSYIRSLISAAGQLDYNAATGVISVDTGYSIPQNGTATHQTLRWNGIEWEETSQLLLVPTVGSEIAIFTGYVRLGATTTSLAPTTGGELRYNTGTSTIEGFNGNTWTPLNNTQNGTATNQILRWNGTVWAASTNMTIDDSTSTITTTGALSLVASSGAVLSNSSTGNYVYTSVSGNSTFSSTTNGNLYFNPAGTGYIVLGATVRANTGESLTIADATETTTLSVASGGNIWVFTSAGIRVGGTADTTAGNIRWNGTNFQGYNGTSWVNLDYAVPSGEQTITNGTTNNSTLRWNGTDWVETTTLSVASGGVTLANTKDFVVDWTEVTTGTTLTNAHYVLLTITPGIPYTVNLPATPTDGQIISLKDTGNAGPGVNDRITISGNGNTIEGDATVYINTPYESLKVMWSSTANTWLTVM